jgi:hypothetical protein
VALSTFLTVIRAYRRSRSSTSGNFSMRWVDRFEVSRRLGDENIFRLSSVRRPALGCDLPNAWEWN